MRSRSTRRPEPWASEKGTRCANCLIPIDGEPVEREDTPYCCEGCAEGGPCVC